MTDQQKRARDEAANEHVGPGQVDYAYHTEDLVEHFIAGADFWHARARVLEEALDAMISMDHVLDKHTWSDVSRVAREALARYREGAESFVEATKNEMARLEVVAIKRLLEHPTGTPAGEDEVE